MRLILLIVSQSALWAIASLMLLCAPRTIFHWFDLDVSPTSLRAGTHLRLRADRPHPGQLLHRHLVYSPRRKNLAMAYTASNTLGFLVTAWGISAGSMGHFSWALAALYLLYALGFAYYRFLDPTRYEHRIEGAHGMFG